MATGLRQIFSKIPATYELVNHLITCGLDIVWRKKLAVTALETRPLKCLDICSGTGETAIYLRKSLRTGSTVFAADFSLPMLKKAADKKEGKEIFFTAANACQLPFSDDHFDVVTLSFAARNLNVSRENLIQALTEIKRILKKEGRFINLETSQPANSLIRKLYRLYVKTVVLPVGALVSGTVAGYKYLSNSIPKFYAPEEFASIIKEAGFEGVSYKPLMFGAAALHIAVK